MMATRLRRTAKPQKKTDLIHTAFSGKELALSLLSLALRIALTRIELRNNVGAHWSVLGASPILKRLPTIQNAVSSPSAKLPSERRRTAFHSFCAPARPASESQEDTNNEDADLGPARVFVGSDVCTGGSSSNGIDADHLHLFEPVPNSPREFGGILRGQREVRHSSSGKVISRRFD